MSEPGSKLLSARLAHFSFWWWIMSLAGLKRPENGSQAFSKILQTAISDGPRRFYEFDDFILDARRRLLFLNGEALDLTPKVFDLLLELVRNSGRVLEKRELMERVWPDSFVEEANLTQHISTLRKKLGSAEDRQRYIMTVPGRGYRFLASVRERDDEALVTVPERARIVIEKKTAQGASQELEDAGIAGARPVDSLEAKPLRRLCTPPEPKGHLLRHHRALFIMLVLPLMAGAASLLYPYFFSARVAPPFQETRLARFTTSGRVTCAAISPDGKYVALATIEDGRESLWLRQVGTSNNGVQVIPPSDFHYNRLTFSPDGDYIYYTGAAINSMTELRRIPKLGGAPSILGEDIDSPPAFSPDGKQITYVRNYPDQNESALIITDAGGGVERRLATLKAPREAFVFPAGPSWSPDGKRISCAVSLTDERGPYQELFEARVADGALKPITRKRWFKAGRAAWMKDGLGIVMLGAEQESAVTQIWYVSYPDGNVRKITNDLDDYKDLSLTADSGVIAAVQSDTQANVWLVPEADAERARKITGGNYDGIFGLAWMLDGRLVYTSLSNGMQNLWVADEAKGSQAQLSESAGNSRSVAISPDGRFIVYVMASNNQQQLWKMDANGGHPQQLTRGVRDDNPAFSPDGQWVVYRSYDSGIPNLFKIPAGGGQPLRLTEKISGPPAVSPDGKLIACTYREEALGKIKLALIPFKGEPPQKLIAPQESARRGLYSWRRDGRALFYVTTRAGVSNIWMQPLDGGAPKQVTNFKSDQIFNFAYSVDGHTLAVARGRVANDLVLINAVKGR
jgi:Tol biopolymer transport system component/DNA-binding winged helix-turn-helix (wHTH) protein